MRPIVKFVLSDGMNTEGQLFRVKKNCSVNFVPDVTLIGKRIRFFINYPEVDNLKFDRSNYRELKAINPTLAKNPVDCFDDYFELSPLPISGSFHFCFTTNGSFPIVAGVPDQALIAGSGYLTIDPHFVTKHENAALENITEHGWNLDGLVIQTYLPKNLGYFTEWESRLMTAKEGKYNMIHFTPMQELGYSRSAYSLRDQLKVNPNFTPPGAAKPVDWDDIQKFLKHLEQDWSVLSMADLVFNHTSNDSPWIHEHPECAYNVVNSPHLVPAYLLDTIVWQLTVRVANGSLANRGLHPKLCNQDEEIPAMRAWLHEHIDQARLDEYFLADVGAVKQEFVKWLISGKASCDYSFQSDSDTLSLKIAGPRQGRRFGGTVDFHLARKLFVAGTDYSIPMIEAAAQGAADRLGHRLHELNVAKRQEVADHLCRAVDNVIANAYYRFYDPHGMKLSVVTEDSPIMWSYFYQPSAGVNSLQTAEAVLDTPDAPRIMAFNGWVINDNPMRNFAEAESYVYLRRELVVWGDSVKLRYGSKPADCPYLWNRMAQYAELTARMFHAVRLDNCHSTPLVVAQYMLDKARAVRPNLYVVAELFTNSEYQDNVFMNKLGLNSLIRESLQAHDAHGLGGHLYRYGVTRPAGAFFTHIVPQRLYPSVAHALLYDQTHDNPSVAQKHCSFDFLPLAALNAVTCCAIGSTRGYDELVPHNIDVVKEERPYAKWPEHVNAHTGIVQLKSILNELHQWLSVQGFTEMFVDQCSSNVIALTRICPETRESVVLVAHTAYNLDVVHHGHVEFKPIELGGHVHRLLLEAQTCWADASKEFQKDLKFINGLENLRFSFTQNVNPMESAMFRVERSSDALPDRLHFFNFPPGSIVVLSVCLTGQQEQALSRLHSSFMDQFACSLHKPRTSIQMGHGEKAYLAHSLKPRGSLVEANRLRMLLADLTLIDFNRILFRCEAEELAEEPASSVYDIPGYGKLCYAGFQAIAALLEDIRDRNDLGHPICAHLRNGDWLAHYLCDRLCRSPKHSEHILACDTLAAVGETLSLLFAPLQDLPRYLVPAYFETMVHSLQNLFYQETILRMSPWIASSSSVIKRLAVATNQFFGFIGNCKLPSPTALLPRDDAHKLPSPFTADVPMYCSLAAGLPHFAEGMWRCWGRDTFIAFRGCLLLTGRLEEAAAIILSYASLVRHGLIPNLTGEGSAVHPRYNCRDAVWFWLYAIVCYEQTVAQLQEGTGFTSPTRSILNRNVWRWFVADDAEGWPQEQPERRASLVSQRLQPLHETIQEVLQRHFTGIDFTERNAGPQLDEQMRTEGFHVTARVNPETGFPEGGNAFNCGTWMDKMGSSEQAGNRGLPATPRDGAAVELVGLAYAVVEWLQQAHAKTDEAGNALYPHSGVQLPSGKLFTWNDWSTRLKRSFEPAFWIPSDTMDPALEYNRGIYRDSVGSSAGYTDNQLRPNFLVTMVVAPALFTPERAWNALELARIHLAGPYGMRTLGTNDMAYRGDYHNDVDSTDFRTSKGFNYHQGPEWLWPTGYYLRARLLFARLLAKSPEYQLLYGLTVTECQNTLARLDKAICSTPWRSLPELTNSNGQFCKDSCAAQAWSVGCALEAAHDLLTLDSENA